MLESLASLLAVAMMGLAAYAVGRPIARALKASFEEPLDDLLWSLSLGLIAWGMILLALGLAGMLYVPVIGVLTCAAAFWTVGDLSRRRLVSRTRHLLGQPNHAEPVDGDEGLLTIARSRGRAAFLARALLALMTIAAAGSFVAALLPPTAGDAMCYHLELPKRFLLEHRIVFLPDSDNSTFPLVVEMWYAWGLALDGGVAAQLVHWTMGALLAMATVQVARPVLGRAWAEVAGCLVYLTPGIQNQMTAPLNDVALAVFVTLAVAAWSRAALQDAPRGWYIVAGAMLGAALGAKYVALVFVVAGAVALGAALAGLREQLRAVVRGTAVMALVAAALAAPWYMRAAWHRGNPVYPFFDEYLSKRTDVRETLPASKAPLATTPWTAALAPWYVTIMPERFGGRGHELGPLFLMCLPGLLFVRRLRGLSVFLWLAATYLVIWYLLRQNVRFLCPVIPLAMTPLAWVLAETRRFAAVPRAIVACFVLAALTLSAARSAKRGAAALPVAAGWESRSAYLERAEPTYRAAMLTRELGVHGAHVLSQDHRAFYFDARVTRENLYRRRTRYDDLVRQPGDLSLVLRDAGFTHVLLAEAETAGGIEFDATLSRLVEAELKASQEQRPLCLDDYHVWDSDGIRRRYRFYWLR